MPFTLLHELENLPARLAKLEAEITTLREAMQDPDLYTSDPARFDATSKRLGKAVKELETSEQRWMELEELRLSSA